MRIEKTSIGAPGFLRASTVVILLASVAACSGDAIRFTDNFYTAAIPTRPKTDVAPINSAPVNTPAQQRSVIANSYPGSQASVTLPPPSSAGRLDPLTTASVTPPRPAAPTFNRVRSPSPVLSQQLPPPAQVPQRVAQSSPRPADIVDTSAARAPVSVAAPQGVDSVTTASVNQNTGPLERSRGWTRTGGTYVTVRAGETIYNLSRRYGVPASAILEANDIADANAIGVGQRVLIPTYVYSQNAPVSAPDANADVRAARSTAGTRSQFPVNKAPVPAWRPQAQSLQPEQLQSANAAPNVYPQVAPRGQANTAVAGGRYTVQAGDTLYGISRRTGASVDGIKQLNGLTSNALRVGQSLVVPGINTASGQIPPASSNIDPITTASTPKAREATVPYTPPKMRPSGTTATQVASIDRNDASQAPDTTGIAKLRWPATGRVITGFGSNDGGIPNEGIDISVPVGTPLKAAENGVVIYAGDGLKELGKTVLVRHGDGLVTVYGHADAINVSRGDSVTRGQTIATSGMSGSATKPKVHFEVRKDTKAVNPLNYLN